MELKLCCILVFGTLISLLSASSGEVAKDKQDESYEPSGRFFLGIVSTSTVSTFSTSTTTVLYSCVKKINTGTTCSGRKRKQLRELSLNNKQNMELLDVSSSMNEEQEDKVDAPPSAMERIFVVSTSTSTIVFMATTTNTATTLAISYSCTLPGYAYPNSC